MMSTHLHVTAERPHPQSQFQETCQHARYPDKAKFLKHIRSLSTDILHRSASTAIFQYRSQDPIGPPQGNRQIQGFQSRVATRIRRSSLAWSPMYPQSITLQLKTDGYPPSIFWDSDVAKWMEAVCYFLMSAEGQSSPHNALYRQSLEELVNLIIAAQQPDGYINIYFTVVDPEGKFMNLRDMHEMYNAGHLLEAALPHSHLTGSSHFLQSICKYIDLLATIFGPNEGQLHGYPGHEELELAVLRLHAARRDHQYLAFADYLLSARGVKRQDQHGDHYFVWEAKERRKDLTFRGRIFDSYDEMSFNQSHLPLHDQLEIRGHAVRSMYLLTAAADLGGPFYFDAKRLLTDAVTKRMYVTGGFGSVVKTEGFHVSAHYLPQGLDEGGGYAETCASIGCMMVCERILSHELDGTVRSTMERCFFNNVLGGASLDGTSFTYTNRLASSPGDDLKRSQWFTTSCCPPNLARTLGIMGGYIWAADCDHESKTIDLRVYLFADATREVGLQGGETALVTQKTGMPWSGGANFDFRAPDGYTWIVFLPKPDYANNFEVSVPAEETVPGFVKIRLPATATVQVSFDLHVCFVAPKTTGCQDLLVVTRGPIVFTAEDCDNVQLEGSFPHFRGVGLSTKSRFSEVVQEICGIPIVCLTIIEGVYCNEAPARHGQPFRVLSYGEQSQTWLDRPQGMRLVPWFARGNRGGVGHMRTAFPSVVYSR